MSKYPMQQDDIPPVFPVPTDQETLRRQAYERNVKIVFFALMAIAISIFSSWLFSDANNPYAPKAADPFAPKKAEALYPHPAQNPYIERGKSFSVASGKITQIVPRKDRMPDGRLQKNFYARTEYDIPELNAGCYFHQYIGAYVDDKVFYAGKSVSVKYQPDASDACGTSQIQEE